MTKSLIKDFYRKIHLDDLTIAYSGNFTESMTEKIIELSEAYLDSNEKLNKLKRKTSFLVAECFQNVVRHSSKDSGESENSINESFFLRFYENRCYIASENLIPNDSVQILKSKLELVNTYKVEELRELYRTILDEGTFSDEGGAGLGLVEMARKTGNKLIYSFENKNDEYSLFYLMLVLENKAADGPHSDSEKELLEIKRIIKNVQEDHMFLLYKGDFKQDIVEHIEEIIERNLDAQQGSLATKVKLYHAAILMMKNIDMYSFQKDSKSSGMLFFGNAPEGYLINATYPVSEENKTLLEYILVKLQNCAPENLEKRSQELLALGEKGSIPEAELIFTQLSMIGKTWDYEFDSPAGLKEELIYQVYI